VLSDGKRGFLKKGKEAHLGQFTSHSCFLIREIIFTNFVTIMINQSHQNIAIYLKQDIFYNYSEIAIRNAKN